MGKKIYGQHQALEYEVPSGLTNVEIIAKIKGKKPTAVEWAAIKRSKKTKFRIGGIGLIAIARRFSVDGDPIKNQSLYLELGRKIYGAHPALEEITNEEIIAKIKEKKPTAAKWASMKQSEKAKFEIGEMWLTAIATRFGVKGNAISNRSDHLELGRKIYGEHPALEELTIEMLIANIKKAKSTADKWTAMDYSEKRKFKIGGIGLKAIASRFGLDGDPRDNHSIHLELGRKIYGAHPVFQAKESKSSLPE